MSGIDRRGLLATGLAGGVLGTVVLASTGLASTGEASCFAYGVASGDPGSDRILLWTRAKGVGEAPVAGRWEVAVDPGFSKIVAQGQFLATLARDHCVKIDVPGLQPGCAYWYRFVAGDSFSPVGRMRTLPVGTVEKLDIVLACCAMYMFGEFHAYRAMAERESLDFVLFVGDYIYEYGSNSFAISPDIRNVEPSHDTVSLTDYRARYAQWRRDPALQAAHARAPWICMWDDHEIANDDWTGGAQHHDAATQGPWSARKAAAVKAYLEWMPIRDPDQANPSAINRSYAIGDLATLILPEMRLEARDRQPTMNELKSHSPEDIDAFKTMLADPERRMVGETQLHWIDQEARNSVAAGRPWVLFGSTTIMARYVYPDLAAMVPAPTRAEFEQLQPGGSKLYEQTGLGLPLFNLDSWDGYPAERIRVYDVLTDAAAGSNLLVLSGDSHMAWANELHHDGQRIGLEISASTLTGPSMGALLHLENVPLGDRFMQDNEDVLWCDHLAVGFAAITLNRHSVRAEFLSVEAPRMTKGRVQSSGVFEAENIDNRLSSWRQKHGRIIK